MSAAIFKVATEVHLDQGQGGATGAHASWRGDDTHSFRTPFLR
jgi:hypothetical protein